MKRLARTLMGRVRIRGKILGIAVGSVVLLGAVLTLYVRQSTQNALRADLRARAASIALQFAASDTNAVLTNDIFGLHESLEDGLKANPDIVYVYVSDPRGKILASTFAGGFPSSLARLAVPTRLSRIVPIQTNLGIVWDASAPMLGGSVGWVHVGLAEQRLRATVNRATREIAALALLVAGLASAGAFGLATVLSTPIVRLQRATEDVARGDFSRRVEVVSNDEIGALTRAFNAMTEALSASQSTLIRQNRDLRVLNAVASSVASTTTLDKTLQAALDCLRQVLDVDVSRIYLANGGQPRLAGRSGLLEAPAAAPFDYSEEVLRSLSSDEPVVVREATDHGALPGTVGGPGHGCCASIPIRSRGRVLGVLQVASADPSRFDEDDFGLLKVVGSELGVAVDNAGLWEEVNRRGELRGRLIDRIFEAQEEERRRVAREIHDHTNQVLSALIVTVDVAHQALADRDDRLAGLLAETRAQCEELLGRLDELVLELRPKLLDDLGLPSALEWLTQGFQGRAGVRAQLQVTGLQARVAPDVESAAFRIVQESLTNVARHADAKEVTIQVRSADSVLEVEVVDDGKGFDASQVSGADSGHFGLLGMRERATVVGGIFQLSSAPGQGTRVKVRLPVRGGE